MNEKKNIYIIDICDECRWLMKLEQQKMCMAWDFTAWKWKNCTMKRHVSTFIQYITDYKYMDASKYEIKQGIFCSPSFPFFVGSLRQRQSVDTHTHTHWDCGRRGRLGLLGVRRDEKNGADKTLNALHVHKWYMILSVLPFSSPFINLSDFSSIHPKS